MEATRLCACCAALSFILSPLSGGADHRKQDTKLRKELRSAYERWRQVDVAYIISDAESAAFSRLQNDDEREQFVEQFWMRRDPTPDTQENEFKDEHYRRFAYANERYASGIPGWKTDRGRIYIMYGAPDEIEAHPSGGTYERPLNQGGGTSTAFPFETWRYRYLENIGTDVVIEFVDPTQTGEYRIAFDPLEKDALRHVPGSTSSLGNAFTANNTNEFDRLDRYFRLQQPPPVKFRDLEAMVTSTVRYNVLPMKVRAHYLRVTDSTVLTPVTVQFENSDLQFHGTGGAARATVNLYLRITSMTRRVVSVAEDVVSVDAAPQSLEQAGSRASVYQKVFYLAPGNYRLNVVAKDVIAGRSNNVELVLRVPQFDPGRWSASSIVLADLIERVPTRAVSAGPFVIGDARVRPRVTESFRPEERLGIYFQVYEPAAAGQRKPEGSLHYAVTRRGSEAPALEFTEEMAAIPGGSAQQVTVEKLLPLSNLKLAPGQYTLRVVVKDGSRNPVLTLPADFQIE